ncbi:hypothetical protein [Variovorax sp. YR216]|uniref:hypothetical protein n=1 Tax=Variovorax sp. YR216 TaxID=1882828 RepID=UPI000895621F|nr:hypothetical protein [Variovorax sp. YR216]SEB24411.1 hypothetical protein SAMN05444680_12057 [Variovorax sp. YR216]
MKTATDCQTLDDSQRPAINHAVDREMRIFRQAEERNTPTLTERKWFPWVALPAGVALGVLAALRFGA